MSVIENVAEAPQELGKSLRPRHVTMITIGGIIGAGLFVGSSASIATTGPAIIVSYALAGLMILIVMRMLSEMAVAHPRIGAFTEFAREGLGNWAGFSSGWLYWFNWAIIAAIEALAGARIIHDWLPQFPVWTIGWALLASLTAVNLLSTRSYGEFEFWFASLKVAAIGTAPLAFGWIHDGSPIPGAHGPVLALQVVSPSDSGLYEALVNSREGTAISREIGRAHV